MTDHRVDDELIIEASGLVKRYGAHTVLDKLDVRVGAGVTGLLGANGAGKTTFLGLVLGLHQWQEGRLSVLGLDPGEAGPDVRARIGYAPEHHDLPADIQAADLVRHIAELHGLDHRSATERASDTLWQVGLGEERYRPIGTMSTGQRQRVKLAQALAHDPKLLLLDEPTDGLDPTQREDMLRLIRRIGTEFGISVVLSSHRLTEVEQICDCVVIIESGRVVRAGRVDHLRQRSDRLLVEVVERADELAARLSVLGLDVVLSDGRLTVAGDDAALAVRDAVADLGVGLRSLGRDQGTLEDVYLESSQ